MRNKRKIEITRIKDHGRTHEFWCDKILMLRFARRVGDQEVINNTQLGALRRNQSEVEFKIVED